MPTRRARMAERRAHSALTRAGFADPDIAAEVLRQVQVLTLTPQLARLNYATADAARAALASLITPGPPTAPPDLTPTVPDTAAGSADPGTAPRSRPPASGINGHAAAGDAAGAGRPGLAGPASAPGSRTAPQAGKPVDEGETVPGQNRNPDTQLITAAARILAEARRRGDRLSQAALADQLRSQGYSIANERLRWLLAEASNLTPDNQPAHSDLPGPGARPAATEPSGPQPVPPAAAGPRANGTARNLAAPLHERPPGQHGPQLPGGP
jgi:hypothetical protein